MIDLRRVNSVLDQNQASCVPDFYNSLKNILPHAKYCTSLDLKQCYYALPVDDSVIEAGINNVLTPDGAYEFLRAITGCSSIPGYILAIFLEFLHKNEKGEYDFLNFLYIFFDDLNIFSLRHETLEEHIDKVIKVLKRLERLNLRIGDIKCKYAVDLDNETIKVFGYDIGRGGIGIPEKKLAALEKLACPKTQKELQSVLGALNFYKSILSLDIQGSMNILYKYITPFRWDEIADTAFRNIIDNLKNQTHKIGNMKPNSVNILICDASIFAVGSVLLSLDVSEFLTLDNILTIPVSTIALFQKYPHIKAISIHSNFFDCVKYFLRKLSFKVENTESLVTQIYQHGGFNLHFANFVQGNQATIYERLKEFLKTVPSPFEAKSIQLEQNPEMFSYTIMCLASLTQSRIHVLIPYNKEYRKLSFGEHFNDLFLLYENFTFYGLIMYQDTKFGKKTVPFFNKTELHSDRIKEEYFKFLQKSKKEDISQKISIIGFYSKAIDQSLLQKWGISFLESYAILLSIEHWEDVIKGKYLYVLSDSNASIASLKGTNNNKRSSKLCRLSQKILLWFKNYDIFFIYIPGEKNMSDFLSRLVDLQLLKFSYDPPKPIFQEQDFSIVPLHHVGPLRKERRINIQEKRRKIYKISKIERESIQEMLDDILNKVQFIRKQMNTGLNQDVNPNTLKYYDKKLILPLEYYLIFVICIHSSVGHMSAEKMKKYFVQNFHMEKKKVISNYIDMITQNCLGCLSGKPNRHNTPNGTVHRAKIQQPNEAIMADLLDFPNNFHSDIISILVIKDLFSQFVTLKVVQARTQTNIIALLSDYFCTHGIVRRIITDNASYFVGSKIDRFYRKMGINRIPSSPRKSKVRGFIERQIGEVNKMVRIINALDEDIDIFPTLTMTSHALNSIPVGNTKLTPFNLHYYTMRDFRNNLLYSFEKFFKADFSYNKKGLEEVLNSQKKNNEKIIKAAREQFLADKQKMVPKKIKKDSKKFRKGDFCLVKIHDSPKFRPIFALHVYQITKIKDYTAFMKSLVSGQIIFRHLSDIKKLSSKKLSLFELPQELTDSLQLMSIDKINELFDIPLARSRKKHNSANPDLQELFYSSDSLSEDDDILDNEVIQKDLQEYPLPTIDEQTDENASNIDSGN